MASFNQADALDKTGVEKTSEFMDLSLNMNQPGPWFRPHVADKTCYARLLIGTPLEDFFCRYMILSD